MNFLDDAIRSGAMRDNPYPVYARLRSEAPLFHSECWDCAVLSRYEDVTAALQNPAQFSSVGRVVNAMRRRFSPTALDDVGPLVQNYSRGLINSDPPDHARMRRLVQSAFVPRVLERLRPQVQAITDELLDRVEPKSKLDIVRDLAFPLPITVIAELLGVPPQMREQFKAWSGGIVEFMATPNPSIETAKRSQRALLELHQFLREVFTQRRREPREDLITALVQASFEGDKLSEEELLSTCTTILIGGHETTTSLLASGVWLLLHHPQALEQLRAAPEGMTVAVEEFLRFEPPFQRILRVAKGDIELHGQTIADGQSVMLLLGAANRDENIFPKAETLDIQRAPNRHIAFGYGIHFCLGAALARLEAPIALNTLLRRAPNLAMAGSNIAWHDGMVRAIPALPVRF